MNSKSFLLSLLCIISVSAGAQDRPRGLRFILSTPHPETHYCHVEIQAKGWNDTVRFKMPKWTPGYYQLMNYAKSVESVGARDAQGKAISLTRVNDNTWSIPGVRNKAFTLDYDVKADRQFVASNYVDSTHAYLVTAGVFMYADGFLDTPASVKVMRSPWTKIATGLEPTDGKFDEFTAPDFDILYDCPILIGNLEELPPFNVHGTQHRFIGYDIGNFDKKIFMGNLQKVVEAGSDVIGDIPYKHYSFIAIGKGRGGIEHLNNTTFSFSGNDLDKGEGMNRMMNFLAHEYFHHYNVKRIRPFELGPFNYDQSNSTNLLWVSEGLSVYYEYLIVRRAGLSDERMLLANFERNISATENNPGRLFQSLAQASYATWSEGPFGTQGSDPGKSISYYEKGPILGLFLDFAIRHATQNAKSLDDVMRFLYWQYYKKLQRGFTDAEFQQACERTAGVSLSGLFEYVYTTKELDYSTYLGYAGLRLKKEPVSASADEKRIKASISRMDNMDALQRAILTSWLSGE